MPTKIQLRRGTATEWATHNPILADGELGLDKTNRIFKIGDGVNQWSALEAWSDSDSFTTHEYTATAAQTTFNATYTVGLIDVIYNGFILTPSDYTATNGTTVVLNNGATAGDSVVIKVYGSFDVANVLPLAGGTITGNLDVTGALRRGGVDVVTTDFPGLRSYVKTAIAKTAVAGEYIYVDTSVALTITLPSTPSEGDTVWVKDRTGNAATNNITVARNGQTIQGVAADKLINQDYVEATFVYMDGDWEAYLTKNASLYEELAYVQKSFTQDEVMNITLAEDKAGPNVDVQKSLASTGLVNNSWDIPANGTTVTLEDFSPSGVDLVNLSGSTGNITANLSTGILDRKLVGSKISLPGTTGTVREARGSRLHISLDGTISTGLANVAASNWRLEPFKIDVNGVLSKNSFLSSTPSRGSSLTRYIPELMKDGASPSNTYEMNMSDWGSPPIGNVRMQWILDGQAYIVYGEAELEKRTCKFRYNPVVVTNTQTCALPSGYATTDNGKGLHVLDDYHLYVVVQSQSAVKRGKMTKAGDLSTLTWDETFDPSEFTGNLYSVMVSEDGNIMMLTDNVDARTYDISNKSISSPTLRSTDLSCGVAGDGIVPIQGTGTFLNCVSGTTHQVASYGGDLSGTQWSNKSWLVSFYGDNEVLPVPHSGEFYFVELGNWKIASAETYTLIGSVVLAGQTGTVSSVCFDANDEFLYAGTMSGYVAKFRVDDLENGVFTFLQEFQVSASDDVQALQINGDGTKLVYVLESAISLCERTLTAAHDLSTCGAETATALSGSGSITVAHIAEDCSRVYATHGSTPYTYSYSVTTPWDTTTVQTGVNFINTQVYHFFLSRDGLMTLRCQTSSTYNISCFANDTPNPPDPQVNGLTNRANGEVYYSYTHSLDNRFHFLLGSGSKLVFHRFSENEEEKSPELFSTIEFIDSVQIDTNLWADLNSVSVVGEYLEYIYPAFSLDGKSTFVINGGGGALREVIRNNAGTWEINTNNTFDSTTWVTATTNVLSAAYTEALNYSVNRVSAYDLTNYTDADLFATALTLDMIVGFDGTAVYKAPTFDQIDFNYDENATYVSAVNGTDYSYAQPTNGQIDFTALIASNFKIRIT